MSSVVSTRNSQIFIQLVRSEGDLGTPKFESLVSEITCEVWPKSGYLVSVTD